MANVTRRIGLSLGADICWPICFEEILGRLQLAIPWEGDTLGFDVSRVTIEPFDLRQPVRYDLVIDRLTHWYQTSREWIKKAVVLNDTYVFNNPWSIQSNEKHTTYCAMMRLGLAVPDTWMVPPKAYEKSADLQPTLTRYAQHFDLGQIGAKLGYPLFMKPYDGGGWVGVTKIDDEAAAARGLRGERHEDHAPAGGRDPLRVLRALRRARAADPCRQLRPGRAAARPLSHGPRLPDRRSSSSELEDITLTINAFFGWDFNSCESLLKGGRWYPIDFANACPDSQVTSLHYHFPWLIKANLRWAIFCAATKRRVRQNLDWQPFFDIAAQDLPDREKLRRYALRGAEAFRHRSLRGILCPAPAAPRRSGL